MKKRLLPALLSIVLCLSLIPTVGVRAEAFSDISDEDVSEAAAVLSGLGIVTGYTDGSFHPDDELQRAQFCALAVRAGGYSDQIKTSAYRTLFTDLKATHWSAPYVNLAQEKNLINGYGNGKFGPNDPVTLAQAVTLTLRLLGYTADEVGAFWPEDYMQMGEELGLMDGISSSANETLTRGEAALLFLNLLSCETKDGIDYVTKLADGTVSGAVVLDNNAEGDDGMTELLSVYTPNGGVSTYEQPVSIPDAILNRRGTLLLDSDGTVAGFVPDENAWRSITLGCVDAAKITSAGGVSYAVPSSAVLVLGDDVTTYGNGWYDLDGRDSVNVFYSTGGSVNLVVASESNQYDGVVLTGYYEDVTPNSKNPTSIKLLGTEFPVDSSAVGSMSQFKVGDRITVTLNGSGEIVSAAPSSTKSANMVGIVEKVSGTSCTVELFSGIKVSGAVSGSTDDLSGELVRVTSSGIGKLSLSTSVTSSVSGALDVSGAKLGSIPLSDRVVIYDRVGNGIPTQVELSDILTSAVSSSKILYASTDNSGEVNVIVLNDVTGDAYTYGILHSGTKSTESGGLTATNRTVAVENSNGTTEDYICATGSVNDEAIGGISVSSADKVTGVAELKAEKSVLRSSFDGTESVVIDGVAVPISDEVQAYNSDNGTWITLSAAKAYSNSVTVYYSGDIGENAVVRVIVTD